MSALFTACYLIYCAFCISRIGSEYLPYWTDEITYLSDTNSFLKTGDSGASLVFNETFSKIGDFGYHGFVYTLYDGFIAKIFALNQNTNVVYVNLLTFAITLLLIASLPQIEWGKKIILTALYCSNWIVSAYLFTYMQEIIQLPIAVFAVYLLFRSYTDEQKAKTWAIVFIILILAASLLRPNWIFWLVGLFPLLRNRKQILLAGGAFILLNLFAFVSFPQINAVYPSGFLNTINVAVGQGEYWYAFKSLVRHFITNVFNYISPADDANWAYTLCNMLPIAGAFLFLLRSERVIKRFYFAVTLIIAINLFAVFLLYDVLDWREVRMMAPVVYLIFAVIVFTERYSIALVLLATQLLFGVSNYRNMESTIAARKNLYRTYMEKSALCSELNSFGNQIESSKNPVTILLPSDEFYGDGMTEISCLPLQNAQGSRIRYSVNLRRAINEFDPKKIDYLISKTAIASETLEEIRQTENYKLYKVKKNSLCRKQQATICMFGLFTKKFQLSFKGLKNVALSINRP